MYLSKLLQIIFNYYDLYKQKSGCVPSIIILMNKAVLPSQTPTCLVNNHFVKCCVLIKELEHIKHGML